MNLYPDISEPEQGERELAFVAFQLHAQGYPLREVSLTCKCSYAKARLLIEQEQERRTAMFDERRKHLLTDQVERLHQVIRINMDILNNRRPNIKGNNPSIAVITATNAIAKMTALVAADSPLDDNAKSARAVLAEMLEEAGPGSHLTLMRILEQRERIRRGEVLIDGEVIDQKDENVGG